MNNKEVELVIPCPMHKSEYICIEIIVMMDLIMHLEVFKWK